MPRTKLAITAAVAWTVLIVFIQTFKGGSVGGRACWDDPTCGEIWWIPPLAWIVGLIVIALVARFWVRRPR
jgi:heme A synthase